VIALSFYVFFCDGAKSNVLQLCRLCGLGCSSFDFAEALVCLFIFSVGLFAALSSNSMTANVPALGEVANFGTDYFLPKIKFLAKEIHEFCNYTAIA
jgi:hypothetical protein